MGRPMLMLYSLVIQKPNPMFKLHHPAITLHTRNAQWLSGPFDHVAEVPAQDALERTPLWSRMMKVFPSRNGHRDPKQQNSPNPPRQESPFPRMPCEQTRRQPTAGLSGTQWLEDLSREPSQHNEPPIPGPSPSSEPPEDVPTCEPEPEVAPMQSTEDPFACPTTPRSIIIINNIPSDPPSAFSFPLCDPYLHSYPGSLPVPLRNPVPRSPHSHDDACQEFTNLRPTLMIP
ncbi:hypothetical protein O181_048965 [Austropuccinia psidii MF-1]|uniref:Uncharacterized protein n=1 Tax=Austropuccinia psidii MF-1 TaxID=1389203 RepID=A0A9Q3DSS8_9BASI|nr:hypothetical protein [Austropuccinia psidii MF-1]